MVDYHDEFMAHVVTGRPGPDLLLKFLWLQLWTMALLSKVLQNANFRQFAKPN